MRIALTYLLTYTIALADHSQEMSFLSQNLYLEASKPQSDKNVQATDENSQVTKSELKIIDLEKKYFSDELSSKMAAPSKRKRSRD